MRKHPLASYFVLAYVISWAFMLPVALSARGIIATEVPHALYYLASFGPGLAALLVTGLTEGGSGLRDLLGRLLRSRPAASAAALLGLLWAGWHLPAFFFRDTYVELGVPGFFMFVVSITFASVVFAWLYNSTGGSILLAILFHVFFNWLAVSEAGGELVAILMSAPVVAWVIDVVRRYGPQHASPLPKQVA